MYSILQLMIFLSIFFGLFILLISKLPVLERLGLGYLVLVLVLVEHSAALFLVLPAFGGLLLIFALFGIVVVLLPQTWKANVKMALRNIGRSRARTTTTMLALSVGIFTIGLILALGQDLRDQVNNLLAKSFHYNVYAITANNDTTTLSNRLKTLTGLTGSQEHPIVATTPLLINGKSIGNLLDNQSQPGASNLGRSGTLDLLSGIEGYDVGNHQLPATDNTPITDGRNLRPDDVGTDNVVIPRELATSGQLHLKVGDTIVLTNTSGSVNRIVNIVGLYQSSGLNGALEPIWGTKETVQALSPVGLSQSAFYLQIDSNQLSKATDALQQAVPNATIFSIGDITAVIDQFLNDIILTLTTIASLALLAGIIIIANAVALAMLERRRELGILKSIGHSSGSLLSEVLLENGIVGAAGALVAMLLVTLATSLLGQLVFKTPLEVSPVISLTLIFGSAGLAMLVSALVAWGAVRVRPLEVLRYE